MAVNRTLLPKPTDRHLALVSHLSPTIEANIAQVGQRGLVVAQALEEEGQYRLGFTPGKQTDLAHVMAMGVPEEAAVEVVKSVGEYDDLSEAPVLVTDRTKGGFTWSLVLLDVRPMPKGGTKETLH